MKQRTKKQIEAQLEERYNLDRKLFRRVEITLGFILGICAAFAYIVIVRMLSLMISWWFTK